MPARGFVLHSRVYRETSALVDLLTVSDGRIRAVARSVRKKGQMPLQPFTEFWLDWRGRSELKTLRQAEPTGMYVRLSGEALYAGLYVNELMTRLLEPEAPVPDLYASYCQTITRLSEAPETVAASLRALESALLAELGYGVEVLAEASGVPLQHGVWYRWDWTRGWLPARTGEGYPGDVLLALARGQYDDPVLEKWARRLYRDWLDTLLGSRPLKARQLYQAYKEKQHVSSRTARGEH